MRVYEVERIKAWQQSSGLEDIQAWQKSRELVREVYKLCGAERLSKDFGLKDQIRRASVSVMSNIAEGFGRNSQRDFAHFLDMAKGSALEVQPLLYVALDVEYLNSDDFPRLYALTDETISMIVGFTLYLRNLPNRYALNSPTPKPLNS